jgi:hypothetical protein
MTAETIVGYSFRQLVFYFLKLGYSGLDSPVALVGSLQSNLVGLPFVFIAIT